MKKAVLLFVLILIMTLVLRGCSTSSIKEPLEISITIKDKEIDYITAKNKWNGNIYDREDTFITILNNQKDIPVIENGSLVEIDFKSNPPDEFKILDILIDGNGRQIYTDKEIQNIPVVLYNGKYTFEIEYHLASGLSSQYEPEKKDIRGFRMIASWGENECEYAFVIKTYTKTDVNLNEPQPIIDRSEYITGEIITDGDYTIIERIGSNFITFIPDKESLVIIKAKYGEKEQYQLIYDDIPVYYI